MEYILILVKASNLFNPTYSDAQTTVSMTEKQQTQVQTAFLCVFLMQSKLGLQNTAKHCTVTVSVVPQNSGCFRKMFLPFEVEYVFFSGIKNGS